MREKQTKKRRKRDEKEEKGLLLERKLKFWSLLGLVLCPPVPFGLENNEKSPAGVFVVIVCCCARGVAVLVAF